MWLRWWSARRPSPPAPARNNQAGQPGLLSWPIEAPRGAPHAKEGGGQMFGTLGVQEMIVIFIVALVLFGPKKLPELGRTIGKAITEFRRASSDLKATFEREMQSLERES